MRSTYLAIVYFVKRSKFSFWYFEVRVRYADIVVKSSRSLSHLLMSSCI